MRGLRGFIVILCSWFASGYATAAASPVHPSELFEESNSNVELAVPSLLEAPTDWDKLLNPDGTSRISFGVRIIGPSPYTSEAQSWFAPASNTKLFTTGAALEHLGPSFHYSTRMEWDVAADQPDLAANLEIIADGDPTVGFTEFGEDLNTRFDRIAARLALRGVKQIAGEITLKPSDRRWEIIREPEGWLAEDRTKCYATRPQAFNVQGNCAFFIVTGLRQGRWFENGVPAGGDPVALDLKYGPRTLLQVEVLNRGYRITGWLASPGSKSTNPDYEFPALFPRGTVALPLPVHHPKEWFSNLLQAAIKKAGIRVVARSFAIGAHFSETLLSAPLSEILVPFNKKSINFIGDALFSTLGERHGPGQSEDLIAAGQQVMARYVSTIGSIAARAAHIDEVYGYFSNDVLLHDGSGLSHLNYVTTGAVMALLMDFKSSPGFRFLWESLPIAGRDGTLELRMRNTAAENVLRAKTGTLRGVYNLSGYVPLIKGATATDFIPFVILSKGLPEDRLRARAAQDRVGAALAELINPSLAPASKAGPDLIH